MVQGREGWGWLPALLERPAVLADSFARLSCSVTFYTGQRLCVRCRKTPLIHYPSGARVQVNMYQEGVEFSGLETCPALSLLFLLRVRTHCVYK